LEQKYESRIGKVPHAQEKVYAFLSDFRHFEHLIPAGQVDHWQADNNTCRFSVTGVGEIGLKMIEKKPNDLLKISGDSLANIDFTLWVQIREVSPGDTRVKLTLKADLNPMLRVITAKPLQQFLEILIKQIESFDFSGQAT